MRTLLNRFLASLVTLVCVLIFTFLLLHLIPGGPFDQERELPPEIKENLYHKYGLHPRGNENFWAWMSQDLSSYVQYLKRGKLGPSLKYRDRDVASIIASAMRPSLVLGTLSLFVSVVGGVILGILAVQKPKGLFDRLLILTSPLFVSFPRFVLAVLLVFVFSLHLKILPPALWEGPLYWILPVVTITLPSLAYIASLTRTGLAQQMEQDFIKTAKSKGLNFRMILVKHAFKNASLPLLTVTGPLAAQMITGSFIVETIFAIPGLGRHFVTAVIDRDYFLVMGITLFYAMLLISLNWIVDLAYLWVDPRMRSKK